MTLVRKRSNSVQIERTNPSDWSALVPALSKDGPRRVALYGALRRSIETGALAPGAKLPTTRDLHRRLGVSRGAAVAAFEMLIADGFAEARVGAGTFVAALVPRLVDPPSRVASSPDRAEPSAPPLPGALGGVSPDERTLRTFRSLVARRLTFPAPDLFGYGDPRGDPALRAEVAAYLRTARGVRCGAEDVIVTAGAQQGLDLFVRAALAPGETVWIEDPCYPMALAAFRGAGLTVVGVPVDAEGLDPARGEARAPRARAVHVTPSHQFPMGVTMTLRRRLALIDWARRAEAWIVEDDYDSEFRWVGAPLAALQGIDDGGRVVYLGTFSKALFPGLRIGYLVAPPGLAERILDVRRRSDHFPATVFAGALATLMREGHYAAHIRRARRRIAAAREALIGGLAEAGLAIRPPDQGLHLVAPLADGVSDVAILPRLQAAGLGARALSPMGIDGGRSGLVIGFSGFPPEALRDAARAIGPVLRAENALK